MYDIKIPVLKSVFGKDTIMKAAYAFVDKAYIHFEEDDANWFINMSLKDNSTDSKTVYAEFENELLIQEVRLNVYNKTHVLRELLLARALTSTFVDAEDSIDRIQHSQLEIVSEDELDKILVDWFDRNEK